MIYQVLLSLKNNEKIFKTVICCSFDWRLKGKVKCIHSVFLSFLRRGVLLHRIAVSRSKVFTFVTSHLLSFLKWGRCLKERIYS